MLRQEGRSLACASAPADHIARALTDQEDPCVAGCENAPNLDPSPWNDQRPEPATLSWIAEGVTIGADPAPPNHACFRPEISTLIPVHGEFTVRTVFTLS